MIRIHTGEIERGQYPKEASKAKEDSALFSDLFLSILNDSYSEDEKDPEALAILASAAFPVPARTAETVDTKGSDHLLTEPAFGIPGQKGFAFEAGMKNAPSILLENAAKSQGAVMTEEPAGIASDGALIHPKQDVFMFGQKAQNADEKESIKVAFAEQPQAFEDAPVRFPAGESKNNSFDEPNPVADDMRFAFDGNKRPPLFSEGRKIESDKGKPMLETSFVEPKKAATENSVVLQERRPASGESALKIQGFSTAGKSVEAKIYENSSEEAPGKDSVHVKALRTDEPISVARKEKAFFSATGNGKNVEGDSGSTNKANRLEDTSFSEELHHTASVFAKETNSLQDTESELDIRQVEKCITDALTQRTEQGTRQMSVRLVPEHLGDLHITIREEGKRLTIKIKASDESVQNVLNEKLSFISQNLKVRGVDVKEIELSGFSEEGSLSSGLLYRDNGEQGRAFEGDERYSGFFENPTDGKQEKIHTGQALSYVSADRVNILI